jgi:ubiquinone/menaquinone biosynthesis C-methylase UbiE
MASQAAFWDRLAGRYARQPIADEAAYQEKLRITRGYLTPETEVLEIGCGTGGTAIIHAPSVRRIRALDISPRMLDIARTKAAAAGVGNVSFEQADILDLAEPPASQDVVLGLSILHLLPDPDALIARVYAMLRPGGVFISSTACVGDTMKALKFIAPLGRALGLLPQLSVMTSPELIAKFSAAGFTIEREWLPKRGAALFVVARKPA